MANEHSNGERAARSLQGSVGSAEAVDVPWADVWRREVMRNTKPFIVDQLLAPKINQCEVLRQKNEAMEAALRTIKGLLLGAEMDGTQWLVLPRVPINVCAQIDMALGEIGPAPNPKLQ